MKFFFKLFSIIFIFLAFIFFIDNFKLTEYLACQKNTKGLEEAGEQLADDEKQKQQETEDKTKETSAAIERTQT